MEVRIERTGNGEMPILHHPQLTQTLEIMKASKAATMAFPASLSSPSSSNTKFQINLSKPKTSHRRCVILRLSHKPFQTCCTKVVSMSQIGEPNKGQNSVLQIKVVKEKLLEAIPATVKELPWKKAADIALKQLLCLGEKALKWCLIAFFVFSFISDVVLSISRNRELMIPFGLFVGCFVTDIMKETLKQVLPISEEEGFEKYLIGIGSLFAAVKYISYGLPIQAQVILLHVANGGLVFWLWKGFNKSDGDDVGNTNASLPMDVKM
ncbi:uncharacterized protein LOC126784376 [Argentina anserina]|uniref:uncharacterized protein LOC126784376 n=1 Tax=Argentina anserina TaxID=57926 RepID=UPI0021767DF1|nr:uncharacterized protein LOC126784376 [Potentilla anserina]